MGDSRKVGKGRGAVFAPDGKTYLEGASIPAGVEVGAHVFDDVDEVEGNVTVTPVKPITAESQTEQTADPDSDPSRGTKDDVLGRVDAGEVTVADALAAEQAKGDKARSTLVEELQGRVDAAG